MADKERDAFWDVRKLIPKKNSTLATFSTKEKLVDVDISGDEGQSDAARRRLTLPPSAMDGEGSFSYSPESSIIKKVTVKSITGKYDFYANFARTAERLWDYTHPKCEYAKYYSYMPQYTQLNEAQKSYYFYWRSEFRRGNYIKTDYSYLYLFVYEIINAPGKISCEEGLELLLTLWREYRAFLPSINTSMAIWIQDYCLIHKLPSPAEKVRDFVFSSLGANDFKEFYLSDPRSLNSESTATFLAYLSDYDWRAARYAGGEHREAYERYLLGAMSLVISRLFEKGELLDCEHTKEFERTVFRSAITTAATKKIIKVEYLPITYSTKTRREVTAALKYTENKLRAFMSAKSRLSVTSLNDSDKEIIDGYFSALLEKARKQSQKAAEPEYEREYDAVSEVLSSVDADEIERSSWVTTARLVEDISEYQEDEPVVEPTANQAVSDVDGALGLDGDRIEFIRAALKGDFEKMRSVSSALGIFADAIAEQINEAFYELLGDVVLEPCEDGYTVIEDYVEEVENWLCKITK